MTTTAEWYEPLQSLKCKYEHTSVNIILHMLKIFNELEPFFCDSYLRINIREYARLKKISPPSSSKRLSKFKEEGLLIREVYKKEINYAANKDSALFVSLSQAYWSMCLKDIGDYLEKELIAPVIIVFGSFSKAEISPTSDIDLAVFTPSNTKPELSKFEKKLNRKIQLFKYKSREEVQSKELLNNILNGYILGGSW